MTKLKPYKRKKAKPYKIKHEQVFSGFGVIPKDFIPEIKIHYSRGKVFLGKVGHSKNSADFLRTIYGRGTIQLQEAFIVLLLNRRNEIIGYYRHSSGGITGTVADIRIIFAAALSSLSTSIILAHNHPSGNLRPSQEDKLMTNKIKDAGKLFDIDVLDHIILTNSSYFSFADENMI